MATRTCPGLPADWLNGWLAAVGAVVLDPDMRLSWSDDPVPLAVLHAPGDEEPANRLADRWPTAEWADDLPITRRLPGHPELVLNPDVDTWSDRASRARRSPDAWMLSSLYTDLVWDDRAKEHKIERGQLHTPMPGRDNTVHDRVRKLLSPVSSADLEATLLGAGRRVANNGLGFDVSRIPSLADETDLMVDPCVEVLAFFGLSVFPTRGDDRRRRQRGWSRDGVMRWYAWRPPLSAAGVDALLDVAEALNGGRHGVVRGSWDSVGYAARGTSDVTRGYGAQRVAERWTRA